MTARTLLPTTAEVQDALGPGACMEASSTPGGIPAIGQVLSAAARDVAYRQFRGRVDREGARQPLSIAVMALVFDNERTAMRTFSHVAQAAHLRTQMEDASVAVETVMGQNGLVSYWGFVHRYDAIVVLALDSLNSHAVSIADLRALVTVTAARLAAGARTNA